MTKKEKEIILSFLTTAQSGVDFYSMQIDAKKENPDSIPEEFKTMYEFQNISFARLSQIENLCRYFCTTDEMEKAKDAGHEDAKDDFQHYLAHKDEDVEYYQICDWQ